MKTIKTPTTARGTRILVGNKHRDAVNVFRELIEVEFGAEEIILPTIEMEDLYKEGLGGTQKEVYKFKDNGGRDICLRPEATKTVMQLFNRATPKNTAYWYEAKCFRYERPQAGRYREFTQLGIEILNPTDDIFGRLVKVAKEFCGKYKKIETIIGAQRGLKFYIGDEFEITADELGAQKQVCGGGSYLNGIGFAVGLDRLLL